MHIFILLLILLTPVGSESEDAGHQEICKPGQCYQILEDALLSYPENLYKLQLAFSSAGNYWTVLPTDRLFFVVCIQLTDAAQQISPDFLNFSADLEWCQGRTCTSDGRSGCWKISWSSSLLYGAVTQQLLGLDNTLTAVMYYGSSIDKSYHYYTTMNLKVNGSLSCNRTEPSSLDEAVITLATWFKAYARAHSKPGSWNNEDKGYVTRYYGYWDVESVDSYNSLHAFRVILLVSFIMMSITAQLFVVILVPRYYCRVIKVIIRGQHTVNSYWSLAIVAAVINFAFFVASFRFLYSFQFTPAVTQACPIKSLCSNPAIHLDTKISYSVRIATMFLALFVDLLVAIWTPKYPAFQPPRCCSSTVWSKATQTFALWNILILLQFHIMSVIPASILIILAPIRSVVILATWAIFLLLFMLIMTNITDICRHNSCRSGSIIYIVRQLFVILALFLLALIAICYLMVYVWGAGRSIVPEFVWSLLSPVFLSLLGWYVRKKFFLTKNGSGMKLSEHIYYLLKEPGSFDLDELETS